MLHRGSLEDPSRILKLVDSHDFDHAQGWTVILNVLGFPCHNPCDLEIQTARLQETPSVGHSYKMLPLTNVIGLHEASSVVISHY